MKTNWLTYVLVIPTLIAVVGCGGPPRIEEKLQWPPPPNDPKIEHVRTVYSSHDLRRSFWGSVKDFLFGRSTTHAIAKPYGLAYDGKSKLYIADTGKRGIVVYDFAAGKSEYFNSLGPHGKLISPVYVALDRNGNILVSDSELGRVVVFDSEHKFSHFLGSKDDFERPVGLAFNKDESRLYVVDSKEHKVKILDPDGSMIGEFGGRGDEKGQFYYPLTVLVTDGDTVYVVDSFHFAVQAFDLAGNYLFSFGPRARGVGPMARPRDIATDSDGNLYITDAVRDNVQMYSRQGQLLMVFGGGGTSNGRFRLPAGVFVDKDDNIYIADSLNRRVQMFQYLAAK